jgi:hypothetical protein
VNTGATFMLSPQAANERVLGIQRKLHKWASDDQDRGFSDLHNLVCDPASELRNSHHALRHRGGHLARSSFRACKQAPPSSVVGRSLRTTCASAPGSPRRSRFARIGGAVSRRPSGRPLFVHCERPSLDARDARNQARGEAKMVRNSFVANMSGATADPVAPASNTAVRRTLKPNLAGSAPLCQRSTERLMPEPPYRYEIVTAGGS